MDSIREGVSYIYKTKEILGALYLDMFAVLFGGAIALLPIFANEILKVGAVGFGFLRSAPSIGALLMAVFITHYPIKKNIGKVLLWCVAGFGFCMIGFGFSTSFWLSMSFLILSGIFDCVSVIVRGTLIHTLTPENMKEFNDAQKHSAIHQNMNSGGGSRGMHNSPSGQTPGGAGTR